MTIDMSAFESQFDDHRYSGRFTNEEFERHAFLIERIEDIAGVIELRDKEKLEAEKETRRINVIIEALQARIEKLRVERAPYNKVISFSGTQNRKDERTKESLERELRRLLEELAARERLAAERNELDRKTDNLPWRIGVNGQKALKHQLEGAHRLVSAKRGLLGDKPGLGKTLQAIMTIDLLRAQGKGRKVLIFTPKPVLNDFYRAFEKWTTPVVKLVLDQKVKGVKAAVLGAVKHLPDVIVLTNYEVWRKDKSIHAALIDCGFDTIFMDEAHVLKNAKSATSQALKEIIYAENQCPKCGGQKVVRRLYNQMCGTCEYVAEEFGDFCSVKNVYPMTGTPILNKPQELWPLLHFIDRQAYPSENAFLRDYCVQQETNEGRKYWTFKHGGSEALLKKLGMRYTARTRDTAGVKMPPQEVRHHDLELDPEKYPRQAKFIELLRNEAVVAFSDMDQMTTDVAIAWYTRMRQAVVWPDGIEIKGCAHNPPCEDEWGMPNPKACYNKTIIFPPPGAPKVGESVIVDEAEQGILDAVESGERVVLFSMFKPPIHELEARLQAAGIRVGKIVGEVPEKKRKELIDDFNTNYTKIGEHQYDVLLCQYQTASVGLNLNGAHQAFLLDREWNPGKEEQAADRVRRLDSEHKTILHMFHVPGTATDLIDEIHEQKATMLQGHEEAVKEINVQEMMKRWLDRGDM